MCSHLPHPIFKYNSQIDHTTVTVGKPNTMTSPIGQAEGKFNTFINL